MHPSTRAVVCSVLLTTFCTLCYSSDDKFMPEVPSECIGRTICGTDEVLNYPGEHIEELLKKIPPRTHLLADDEDVHREPPNKYNDLVRRKRDLPSYVEPDANEGIGQVCKTAKRTIAISAAKNTDNEWRFIVNTPDVQEYISVELCLSAGSACTVDTNVIENSTCRQKYINRNLLSVNETGGIAVESFRIPSVCSCYYNNLGFTNINNL